MRGKLLQVARTITDEAENGVVREDLAVLRCILPRLTANLDRIKR
jgi:hypothetical protein